jgi:hypothetical protein
VGEVCTVHFFNKWEDSHKHNHLMTEITDLSLKKLLRV